MRLSATWLLVCIFAFADASVLVAKSQPNTTKIVASKHRPAASTKVRPIDQPQPVAVYDPVSALVTSPERAVEMPTRSSPDTEIAQACPTGRFIGTYTWDSKASREWPGKYLTSFDAGYATLYKKAQPGDLTPLNKSYRQCIDGAIAAIKRDVNYVVVNQQRTWCAECSVSFSSLGAQVPRLRIIEGLSYLASPRISDQDWNAAATTVRAALTELGELEQQYVSEADKAYEAKGEFARKEQQSQFIGVMLGAIVGGVISKDPNFVNTYATSRVNQINAYARKNFSDIENGDNALFSYQGVGKFSDDGVRITVPLFDIFSKYASGTGNYRIERSMGALSPVLYLDRIVRVMSGSGGYCTGSFIGPRLILTNRHCVFSADGKIFEKPRGASISRQRNTFSGFEDENRKFDIIDVVYSTGDHTINRRYDWALLETSKASPFGWLGYSDPSKLDMYNLRVAVAGFSSDLNGGSQITMDWGCRANVHEGVIYHKCRTWKGASGSPIIAVNRDGMSNTVIGVHAQGLTAAFTDGIRLGSSDPELFVTIDTIRRRQEAQDSVAKAPN